MSHFQKHFIFFFFFFISLFGETSPVKKTSKNLKIQKSVSGHHPFIYLFIGLG
jgi:hypothetical protein